MNRPLTIKEWFESLGKMIEEFDWKGNEMSKFCTIDKTYPAGLVPTPDVVSVNYKMEDKLWCVMHKETGKLLHIRINDDNGVLLTAPESLDWWIGRDEAHATAQASMLGDDFVSAFFVCTGEANAPQSN